MTGKKISMALLWLVLWQVSVAQQPVQEEIHWSIAANLPPPIGGGEQIGLAGVAGGLHNNALLIAGGANFPDGMPWEGGSKKYWNPIYVLLKNADGSYTWHDRTFELPRPLAYSASVGIGNGILLIGGEKEEGIQSAVQLLQWDEARQEASVQSMPPLPLP